jgi:hypothetical protein
MKAILIIASIVIGGSHLHGGPSENIFVPSPKWRTFTVGPAGLVSLEQMHRRTGKEKLVRIIRHNYAIEVHTGRYRDHLGPGDSHLFANAGITVSMRCTRGEVDDGVARFFTEIETMRMRPDHAQFNVVDQAVAKLIEYIEKRAPYDARDQEDYVNDEDAGYGLMLMESYQDGVGYKYIVIPKVDTELDLLWRKFLRSKGKKPGQEETSGPLKEKT